MRNVNTLKIGLASIVILAHTYFLAGWGYAWLGPFGRSDLAVQAFFVISGYLIFRSFDHSETIAGYFSRRLRRILPAYVITVIVAAVLGGFVTVDTLSDYISAPLFKYLLWNVSFLNFMQPTLPGVFETNLSSAVNGSLWTIKIELMFYAAVPAAVLLIRKFGPPLVLGAMYVGSLVYIYAVHIVEQTSSIKLPYEELARQLPGQLRFFVAGALAYYAAAYLRQHALVVACLTLMAWLVSPALTNPVFTPIVIAGIFVTIMHLPFDTTMKPIGDPSYGLYLFHFPIIQVFAQFGLLKEMNWLYPLLIYLMTFGLAVLSWRFVELPWIRQPRPITPRSPSLISKGDAGIG